MAKPFAAAVERSTRNFSACLGQRDRPALLRLPEATSPVTSVIEVAKPQTAARRNLCAGAAPGRGGNQQGLGGQDGAVLRGQHLRGAGLGARLQIRF